MVDVPEDDELVVVVEEEDDDKVADWMTGFVFIPFVWAVESSWLRLESDLELAEVATIDDKVSASLLLASSLDVVESSIIFLNFSTFEEFAIFAVDSIGRLRPS